MTKQQWNGFLWVFKPEYQTICRSKQRSAEEGHRDPNNTTANTREVSSHLPCFVGVSRTIVIDWGMKLKAFGIDPEPWSGDEAMNPPDRRVEASACLQHNDPTAQTGGGSLFIG